MLASQSAPPTDAFISSLRQREFSRLDRAGLAYLDYTGAALYADSQLQSHRALLELGVFGNPHSENDPSRASSAHIQAAREAVLRFLDADPARYTVCFTANSTAAIKLVAESYPFGPNSVFVLSADNHNSVNGIREYARRAGAAVSYISLDDDLRLANAGVAVGVAAAASGSKLVAFPAQSNFSGVQHPLELVTEAQSLGFDVLIDAAAFAPSNPISLRAIEPQFIALSFYKIFGYPTGVGALVMRRDAVSKLMRPWFAGGTVEFASVQNDIHSLRPNAEGFEDGTPDFLSIAAIPAGFAFIDDVGVGRIHEHVTQLTRVFLAGLCGLAHADGQPAVRVYGPRDLTNRGGTVTFNVLSSRGIAVPYADVERGAREIGIALRGGCFCNPGAAEHSFGFDARRTGDCLRTIHTDAAEFSVDRLRDCLGHQTAVGAVRASFGIANSSDDVARALAWLGSFSK